MEKQRKYKTIGLIAVIVSILGLTIAFAALSTTLNISGTAKAEASVWDVEWELISGETYNTHGTATVQNGKPSLSNSNTTLDLGVITLHKPGDYVTYRLNIANKGDIDAMVTGVTGVSLSQSDAVYVEYSVKYLYDNIDVTAAGGRLIEGGHIENGSVVGGERKEVIIEVRFKDSVTTEQYNQIPEQGLTVAFNNVTITAGQATGSAVADTAVNYDITFKDFTQVDWDYFSEEYGTNGVVLFFTDSNDTLGVISIEEDEDNEGEMIFSYVPDAEAVFEGTGISYIYIVKNNTWYERDAATDEYQLTSAITSISNVKLADASTYATYEVDKLSSEELSKIATLSIHSSN